jgi:DNA topoisomerase-3
VLTYPRTDSRALPEDYLGRSRNAQDADRRGPAKATTNLRPLSPFAHQIWRATGCKPNKRIFNNAKISDHFAIIPTLQAPKHLSEPEQKLYDLVVRASCRCSIPAAEYLVTTRITRVEGEPSRPKARCWSIRAGWRSMARKPGRQGRKATWSR